MKKSDDDRSNMFMKIIGAGIMLGMYLAVLAGYSLPDKKRNEK